MHGLLGLTGELSRVAAAGIWLGVKVLGSAGSNVVGQCAASGRGGAGRVGYPGQANNMVRCVSVGLFTSASVRLASLFAALAGAETLVRFRESLHACGGLFGCRPRRPFYPKILSC